MTSQGGLGADEQKLKSVFWPDHLSVAQPPSRPWGGEREVGLKGKSNPGALPSIWGTHSATMSLGGSSHVFTVRETGPQVKKPWI